MMRIGVGEHGVRQNRIRSPAPCTILDSTSTFQPQGFLSLPDTHSRPVVKLRAIGSTYTAEACPRSHHCVVLCRLVATRRYGSFEWEEAKAHTNFLKHGFAFEEALTAFADPFAIDAPDRYLPGRFVLIGVSARNRTLFVVYEERQANIRLISARKASPIQRRIYEEEPDAT